MLFLLFILQILVMKKLKQTLGKQDHKKTKTQNASSAVIMGKKSQFHDLNTIILCRSPNKTMREAGFDAFLVNLIQNSVIKNGIVKMQNIVKQIIEKLNQNQKFNTLYRGNQNLNKSTHNEELKKLEEIKQLVQYILKKDQQSEPEIQSKNLIITKFYEQLGQLIKKKNKISRTQKLEQYDRLIKLLSPRKIYKDETKKQTPNQSSKNFTVKITKQEFEIKRQQSHDSSIRIGSEGKRVKTSGSSRSLFKSENGHEKLRKLMQKQPSVKIIKTKVQYDYSAILEASKSKIQSRSRNITTANSNKGGNDMTTKLNKAKKNQAFVFYRPKQSHKKCQ